MLTQCEDCGTPVLRLSLPNWPELCGACQNRRNNENPPCWCGRSDAHTHDATDYDYDLR